MRPFPMRISVRRLMVAVGFAAVGLALVRPPRGVGSPEQAIQIAADHAMRANPSFHPENHRAMAYRLCGMSPWTVAFYPDDGAFVVLRASVSTDGDVRGFAFFDESERVEGDRESLPKYVLDQHGIAVGMASPANASALFPLANFEF